MNNFLSSNTEKWYQSRLLWLGVLQVAYGIYVKDSNLIIGGLATAILRIDTKNALKFKRDLF